MRKLVEFLFLINRKYTLAIFSLTLATYHILSPMNRIFFCFLFVMSFSNYWAQIPDKKNPLVDSILVQVDTMPALKDKVMFLVGNAGRHRYQDFTANFINKSIQLSAKNGSNKFLAHGYYSKANYHYYRSQKDSAAHFLFLADSLSTQNDPILKALIYTTMSGLDMHKGNYIEANNKLFKAKSILETADTAELSEREKFNVKGQICVINNTLATNYSKVDDFETAVYYYDLSYKASIELKNTINSGIILANKGEMLIKLGKFNEALEIQKQGKELKIKGGAPARSIANSDLNIGIAFAKMNRSEEGLINIDNALSVFEKVNYPSGIMNSLVARGEIYNSINKYNLAISDCEKSKSISIEKIDLRAKMESCKCLHEAYSNTKNYKQALTNHEIYLKTKDSIFNEKNIKKLTQMELQYDFEKKQEVKELEVQAEKKESNLIIRGLIIGLSLLFIVLLLLYRLIKLRRKKNLLLKIKNEKIEKEVKEKEILLKEIHHRVKNNLQVISSLLSLQSRQINNPQAQQAINEGRDRVRAMALIHNNLYQDKDLVGVEAQTYIEKLAQSLFQNYQVNQEKIKLESNIDDIKLDVDTIIPLGLIINELMSNTLKYAFEGREEGKIKLDLLLSNSNLKLSIEDDGVGLKKEFDIEKSESLGYKIIKAFSQKLNANMNIDTEPNNGTRISFEITNFKAL